MTSRPNRGFEFGAVAYVVVRLGLAGVFLLAGTLKIGDPDPIAEVVRAFGLVPDGVAWPLAAALPVVEILTGLALALDLRGALTAVAGMLVVFGFVLGYGMWLGLDVDCGCFGPGEPEGESFQSLGTSLGRNMLMLILSAYLFTYRAVAGRQPRAWERPRTMLMKLERRLASV